jgi:hypothetical protein
MSDDLTGVIIISAISLFIIFLLFFKKYMDDRWNRKDEIDDVVWPATISVSNHILKQWKK